MRVKVSPEAAAMVRERGGRLWVWAARPPVCCWGTPAYMHAATERPASLCGFSLVSQADVDIWFRAPAGRSPEVLEIGLRGRRRPRVEAYWDGLRVARRVRERACGRRPGEIPAPRPQAYLTNTGRLMHRTGLRPPAEADAAWWAGHDL